MSTTVTANVKMPAHSQHSYELNSLKTKLKRVKPFYINKYK